MSRIYGAWKGYKEAKDLNRQTKNDQLEQAKSMVALQEAGYNYDPKANTLSRSEQFGAVPEGYQKFGGKLMPDRSVGYQKQILANKNAEIAQRPLNELQQLQKQKIEGDLNATRVAGENKEENLRNTAEGMIGTIEEVKKTPQYFGPAGDLPTIVAPSTYTSGFKEYGPRANWEANVQKLLSGRVLSIMNEMKSASKTGATGFGQLSDKEGQLLREASTALNRRLPPEQAKYYLDQLEGMYQKVLQKGGGSQKFGQPSASNSQPTDDPLGVLS